MSLVEWRGNIASVGVGAGVSDDGHLALGSGDKGLHFTLSLAFAHFHFNVLHTVLTTCAVVSVEVLAVGWGKAVSLCYLAK